MVYNSKAFVFLHNPLAQKTVSYLYCHSKSMLVIYFIKDIKTILQTQIISCYIPAAMVAFANSYTRNFHIYLAV